MIRVESEIVLSTGPLCELCLEKGVSNESDSQ